MASSSRIETAPTVHRVHISPEGDNGSPRASLAASPVISGRVWLDSVAFGVGGTIVSNGLRTLGVALVAGGLAAATLASCSSSSPKAAAPAASSAPTSSTVAVPARCVPPAPQGNGSAVRVAGTPYDWVLTSFDGTKIRLHWFLASGATAAHPHPTVLMGPGWGESGDTNTTSTGLFGALNVGSLMQHGYNVLTWDPRGFGQSSGTVETDSAAYEGRDVQAMLDWISKQPGVELDAPRDPRVGMTGASYGGGIQLVVAAIDCRVDAIVPTIAWHSLTTSLFKAETPKNGWAGLLFALTAGHSVDPHIIDAHQASITTGVVSAADRAWFAGRGPADLVSRINVPTLIVQGTVDTLFTLDEGITNYGILRGRGVPVAMMWFCGGHGVCLTNPGDLTLITKATIAWLDRYVKRDTNVATGPRFEFVDQNGASYTASDYPLPTGAPITAVGAGALRLVADGGSGPAHPAAGNKDPVAGVASSITPARGDDRGRSDRDRREARSRRRCTAADLVVQGDRPGRCTPDARVRAARRRRDRPRRRQPDHADRGHARRRGPPGVGPARGHRVHRARGRAPDASTRRDHRRVRAAAPRWRRPVRADRPVAAGRVRPHPQVGRRPAPGRHSYTARVSEPRPTRTMKPVELGAQRPRGRRRYLIIAAIVGVVALASVLVAAGSKPTRSPDRSTRRTSRATVRRQP